MSRRLLNFILILTSLLGYLEWGGNNRMFLFQMEYEVFIQLFNNPISVLHPLIVLPMVGQVLLLITVLQREPNKYITVTGIVCLSLLLGLIFFIGIISLDFKIVLSTIPFLMTTTFVFRCFKVK